MANEIVLEGFEQFNKRLKDAPHSVEVKADAIVYDHALKWVQLAKRSAPKNFGSLAGKISAARLAPLSSMVVSPAKYSPYREWGTGAKVSVPGDLTNYAMQFKGQKKVIGSKPTPFFFIHREGIKTSLTNGIKKILDSI